MEPLWSPFGAPLEPFWSPFGVPPLEPLWSPFGAHLEHLWSPFGAPLVLLWSTFGAPLEHLWSRFVYKQTTRKKVDMAERSSLLSLRTKKTFCSTAVSQNEMFHFFEWRPRLSLNNSESEIAFPSLASTSDRKVL